MKYNKLVRDKIPEILASKKLRFSFHYADEEEYTRKLDEKLLEEVNEYLESKKPKELVDILEVIYAICELKCISQEELGELRKNKGRENGNFLEKIILDEVRD